MAKYIGTYLPSKIYEIYNKKIHNFKVTGVVEKTTCDKPYKVGTGDRKVALLDLHLDSAQKYADEINANGGIAKAFEANVLKKDSLIKCHQEVLKEFGKCDILINGAGGNNPLATTDNEFAELDDI